MRPLFVFTLGIAAAVAALVVIGEEETTGASEADAQQQEAKGENPYAELVKVDGKFQETFVLPGVDFGQFNKVFFWEAQFEYRDVGPARKTRSTMLSTHKREFGISDKDRQKFEDIVSEAFDKEISKAKAFSIVDSIDDIDSKTLILRGSLLDIISSVPPDTVGRSDVYLSSVGAATFVIEFIAANTGSVVALVAERRSIQTLNSRGGGMAVPANSASVMGDIRRWSGDLARRLRSRLEKAIKDGVTS